MRHTVSEGLQIVPELSAKRIKRFIEPFRVRPGRRVTLRKDFKADTTAGYTRSDAGGAQELLQQGVALLTDYQARLAASGTDAVLVVLQAMDAAGKDGTIKHVMSGVNPQGTKVHSFKVPSAEELSHDYLWRYEAKVPSRGEIAIFNRSYYEEVLVVRVHPDLLARQRLPPSAGDRGGRGSAAFWRRRFQQINQFEKYLTENGIHIVKLFLHVSNGAQKARFLSRIDEPDKNWKFTAADVREREYWNGYQAAFADVLSHTSTEWAPWYVVPADHKWFSRIVAAGVIANALVEIEPRYPSLTDELRTNLAAARRQLERESRHRRRGK